MKTAAATWRSAHATDPGLLRTANEDRVLADPDRGIFLVVDGVGGHAAGDRAAEIAVDVIERELDPEARPLSSEIRRAITEANNAIYRAACSSPDAAGMACVLTLAVLHDDLVTAGHVGDSRLYLAWNGTVRKVTSDHSPVGELEDSGALTEAQAMVHPRRNEVFRDVGSRERTIEDDFIEVRSVPLHPGAALLLCSDGLSDLLTSTEIAEIIDGCDGDPEPVAAQLVAAANQAGGRDNVSVVFIVGPEFIGARSPRALAARARHATTRPRVPRRRFDRGRLLWLVVGMLLGIALFALAQKIGGFSL